MDDRKLKTFLTAVETGSFSKTAEEMNFSQSAVSQMMNSLEAELGCKILERTHSGIKLTEVGMELYPFIVRAEASISQLKNHAEQIVAGEMTQIRIGCFSSISKIWLPKVLYEYQELYPDTNFDIMVGGDKLIPWLQEGVVDVVIADVKLDTERMWYPLIAEKYCAVVPKKYVPDNRESIELEKFFEYPLIQAPASPIHPFLDKIKKKAVKVSAGDDATLLALVEKGLGVTLMPEISLQNVSEEVKILKLIPEQKRILGITGSRSGGKAVEKFCEYLYKYHSQFTEKVS